MKAISKLLNNHPYFFDFFVINAVVIKKIVLTVETSTINTISYYLYTKI